MLISHFLDYMQLEKNYSKHTITAYKNDLISFGGFIEKEFDQKEIITANYSQIRSWIVSMVELGLTNQSINRKISSLKTYYKFLLKTKQLKVSPLTGHHALKIAKKVQIPFSENEINEVIALFPTTTFEGTRNKLILELLYTTGIRRAELIGIKMKDLDLTNKTLKVLGKRNKERIVPLLNNVTNSAQEYLSYRKEIENSISNNYLLISKKGVKLNESLVYRIINNYFSKVSSKVKKSPHILRHSFATHLLNEGANMNAVKELLGHASLASTQVYTHNSMAELSDVHRKSHPRNKMK